MRLSSKSSRDVLLIMSSQPSHLPIYILHDTVVYILLDSCIMLRLDANNLAPPKTCERKLYQRAWRKFVTIEEFRRFIVSEFYWRFFKGYSKHRYYYQGNECCLGCSLSRQENNFVNGESKAFTRPTKTYYTITTCLARTL